MSIISEQNEKNAKIRLDLIKLVVDMETKVYNLKSEQGVYERKKEFINASTIEGVALGSEMSLEKIKEILEGNYQ